MSNLPTGVPPQRLQRRRTKGWRKPAGVIIVSRPSRWANPFRIGQAYEFVDGESGKVLTGFVQDRTEATSLFRGYLLSNPELMQQVREQLAGKDLMCFCPLDDQPCHADVLLEVAAAKE